MPQDPAPDLRRQVPAGRPNRAAGRTAFILPNEGLGGREVMVYCAWPSRPSSPRRRPRRGGGRGRGRVLRKAGAAAAGGTLLRVPFGEGREGQGRTPARSSRGPARGRRERPGGRPGEAGPEPAHRGRPILEPRSADAAPAATVRRTGGRPGAMGRDGSPLAGRRPCRRRTVGPIRHGAATGHALGLAARAASGCAGRGRRRRGCGAASTASSSPGSNPTACGRRRRRTAVRCSGGSTSP